MIIVSLFLGMLFVNDSYRINLVLLSPIATVCYNWTNTNTNLRAILGIEHLITEIQAHSALLRRLPVNFGFD